MKYSYALRLLPLCLAFTLASCGGGGGDSSGTEPPAAGPSPAPEAGGLDPRWRQTAYLRTELTNGSVTAPGFHGTLALVTVALCNDIASAVTNGLAPPFVLPDSAMAAVNVDTVERYFDRGVRAASHVNGLILRLPDMQRYLEEARGLPPGTFPAAPDCSVYRLEPRHSSLLWINGRRYSIDHDLRTAKGYSKSDDFVPRDIAPQQDVDRWPGELHSGQRCLRVATTVLAGSTVLGDLGTSCVWDNTMPMKHFLGWPWALVADGQLNGVVGNATVVIRPLETRMNSVLPGDDAQLRIPEGYTVTESD